MHLFKNFNNAIKTQKIGLEKMENLRSKLALITGATSGIGEALSHQFSKNGIRLILVGRRIKNLQKLARVLDVDTHILNIDISNRETVVEALSNLPESFSNVDILVNNAGLALGLASSAEADLGDWEQMIDTNIKGLLYCSRTVLPKMIERNRGHIINIGSVAASYPYPGGNVYGGTKAFVRQCSLNMRADLLGTNIRVSCIEPGMTETEFLSVRFKGDTQKANSFLEGANPMTAAEVAEVIYFVATAPSRLNINLLELMPVSQAFGPLAIHRE